MTKLQDLKDQLDQLTPEQLQAPFIVTAHSMSASGIGKFHQADQDYYDPEYHGYFRIAKELDEETLKNKENFKMVLNKDQWFVELP